MQVSNSLLIYTVLQALKDISAGHRDDDAGICYHVENACRDAYIDLVYEVGEEDDPFEESQCSDNPFEEYWDSTKYFGFQSWEHYSGDTVFPVPVPAGASSDNPAAYFMQHSSDARDYGATEELSMWRGEYGRKRISLLRHLIKHYTELLVTEVDSIAGS